MNPRVLVSVAPTVLILVAVHQISLARSTPLTSWKGGGFGMFAEIHENFIKAWLLSETTEQAVWVDNLLADDRFRLVTLTLAMPTERNAGRLAEAVEDAADVDDGRRWIALGVYAAEFIPGKRCGVRVRRLHFVRTVRGTRLEGGVR